MAKSTAQKIKSKIGKTPDPDREQALASHFPTYNPSTNLLMADIVMRTGTYMLRGIVEKKLLRGRYGEETAEEIVENKSMVKTVISVAVAKFATKSVPGAVVVGSGIAAKALYDRRKKRRSARAEGDRQLLEKAGEE